MVDWSAEAPGCDRPFNQSVSDMSTSYNGPSLMVMKFNVNTGSRDYKRNWPRLIFHLFCILVFLTDAALAVQFSFMTNWKWKANAMLLIQNLCTQFRITIGGCLINRNIANSIEHIWPECPTFPIITPRANFRVLVQWTQNRRRARWRSRGPCVLLGTDKLFRRFTDRVTMVRI